MSNVVFKNLTAISNRLAIYDQQVLSKTQEYLRVLQTKNISTKLNDTAKAVLCLDLVTGQLGIAFNKEIAVTLSGLRKLSYQNNIHFLEKILGIDKVLTISDICVQFDCMKVKDDAETVLKQFVKTKTVVDENSPQYMAAAVLTACKVNHVKVSKSQLATVSRLKSTEWKELILEYSKFVESLGLSKKIEKRKQKDPNKHIILNADAKLLDCSASEVKPKDAVEEYKDWKKRILEEAKLALALK